jgi:NADPH-dependent 2,4-dienoyl-CoA reductase/sulfur reductase-like enzyme
MNKKKANVVIVGSGFSGLVAANILSDYNLSVLLIDENIHIGGQLLRKIPEDLGLQRSTHPDHVKKIGFALIDKVKEKKVEIVNRARMIGYYPGNEILVELDESRVVPVVHDVILFATGARERFLPFRGWTLPGVYSTGLVQVMLKSHGVLCSERLLIGGSGLFLMAVAYEFLRHKGKVLAICEQSGMMDKIKFLPLLASQLEKFLEGGKYFGRILLSGVPIKYRTGIVEARGKGVLEEVVVARTTADGKTIPGTEKIYRTDALAVGYGFVPNIDLPQLAGCNLEYSAQKGGWVVQVNSGLETSVENVFAAGEITGIGGAFKSIHEGEIAAHSILLKFEKITREFYSEKIKKMTRKREQDLKFGALFNSLFQIPEQCIRNIPDDTIVCRCEDVRMGDIKDAIDAGFSTPGAMKIAVRCGMGNCQGRTCTPLVTDLLQTMIGVKPGMILPFSVRPPVKPVSISSLANYKTELFK